MAVFVLSLYFEGVLAMIKIGKIDLASVCVHEIGIGSEQAISVGDVATGAKMEGEKAYREVILVVGELEVLGKRHFTIVYYKFLQYRHGHEY